MIFVVPPGPPPEPAPDAGRVLVGRVAGARGGPPPGAVLTLIDARGRQAAQARPDAAGTFRLAAPGGGEYVLLASAPGYLPRAFTARVPARQAAGPLAIVLDRLERQVEGLVRAFPSGAPVAGALVVATDESGVVRDTTRSGADGSYALGGLAAGPHTVTATCGAMWPAAVSVTVPGSARTVGCNVEMLEPVPSTFRSASDERRAGQPAAGSASPATSASTSPVCPARTARPPSTTT